MSQDVNNDWQNREFIEGVELAVRKCVDFLNHFQESAQYRLSVVDQRLSSLERQLDFLEAQLKNSDPSARGAKVVPFKSSIFDPSVRKAATQKKLDQLRTKTRYTGRVIAPAPIVRGAGMNTVPIRQAAGAQRKMAEEKSSAANMAAEQKSQEDARIKKAQADARAKQQAAQAKAKADRDAQAQAKAKADAEAKRQRDEADRRREAEEREKAKAREQAKGRHPPPPAVPGAPGSGPGGPGSQPGGELTPGGPGGPGYSMEPGATSGGPGGEPGSGAAPVFPHGDPTRIDFQVVVPGSGRTPQATSSVEIEYTGWLSSGKQFIRHKEVIHMGQRQNIKGLEQGCQATHEGGTIKLWIPAKLGYGSRGAGSLIPPNENLTFELKLIKIHKY